MKQYQQTKRALGSTAVITIVVEDSLPTVALFHALWEYIEAFEARFSRFRQTSELTKLNNYAGEPFRATSEFVELATAAKSMAEETKGLYSPFILPVLQRAGYEGSWPEVTKTDPKLNYKERDMAHYDALQITGDTICIPKEAALDFGGIGKGYALDELAQMLEDQGITNYWLSLGGDIICCGYDVDGNPWQLQIASPHNDEKLVAALACDGNRMAMATSGITKRRGSDWHHIINPRSGRPAVTDIDSATVACQEGYVADVLAKVIIVSGSQGSKQWIERTDVLGSLQQVSDTLIATGAIVTV